jgi:SanA protein
MLKNVKSKIIVHRKLTLFFIIAVICGGIFLLVTDLYIGTSAKDKIYRNIEQIPHKKAALVLGTAKFYKGRKNPFYENRLNAVTELWASGKIDAILVSGDNSRKDYDEPTNMKRDLIDRGIPPEYITIDYAGFRTLDSVVRADEIFGLEDYIIVSQPFHCIRAIFLAEQHGQKAIGYCAKDVISPAGIKTRLREVLARSKAVMDVVTGKKPKYLGKKEVVVYKTLIKKTQT